MTLGSAPVAPDILRYIKETGGRPSMAQFEEDQGSKGLKVLKAMVASGLVRIEEGRIYCVTDNDSAKSG